MAALGSPRAADRPPASGPEFPHIRAFVSELAANGLRHVCISPGARSTPLTLSFARHDGIRCWSHIDERSNAFFALGIAKATKTPTALVCTSGTAAANFFPAVIEAAHSGVPLVVLTADRPPELRDCEAGQTIDQIKLYGGYPKWFAEAGMDDCGLPYFRTLARRALSVAAESPAGVVHLNFPLREPLIADGRQPTSLESAPSVPPAVATASAPAPHSADVARLASLLTSTPRGIVVCGASDRSDETAGAICALAEACGYPIVADPTSQLRRIDYADRVLDCYDSLLASDSTAEQLVPDLVLRFGGLPVCKPLRLWLERHAVPQIVVDAERRWNDPSGTAAEVWHTDAAATCRALLQQLASDQPLDAAWSRLWFDSNRRARRAKDTLVSGDDSMSGVGMFARLARTMPDGSTLYVGNSLPIRQLEAVWPCDAKRVRVLCNRGANGIDGVVSSVLGAAAVSDAPVIGVLGDLSFYHDLNGLLANVRHDLNATFVVLNNDGGGIFSMLPQTELGDVFDRHFTTPHGLDFGQAAKLYDCAYQHVDTWGAFERALADTTDSSGVNIIEVAVDRDRDIEITRRVITASTTGPAD